MRELGKEGMSPAEGDADGAGGERRAVPREAGEVGGLQTRWRRDRLSPVEQ